MRGDPPVNPLEIDMFSVRATLLFAALTPVVVSAQRVERFSLRGDRAAVYNIAGKVTVEHGSGNAVVVEIVRGGADASRLRIEEKTVDGRTALCVVYPNEKIIYRPENARNSNWSTTTSTDNDCQGGGTRSWLSGGGRRIEVRSRGEGVEAWADIRVLVPTGHNVKVRSVVGGVDVAGVDATLDLDVSAASITTRSTRGPLNIDTGSGSVSVDSHRGNLTVDVGSGSVQLNNVDATSVNIDTGSGSLRGNNVTADDFSLDTGSGSIEFGGVNTRRMRVDTGSGGARLGFTSNVESLDVDTGSGSVTLSLPSSFSAQLDISTGSGGIDSDFPVQASRTSRHELRGSIGGGRGRVVVETGSGSVRLIRSGDRAEAPVRRGR
jgi:lia operon protein LiaG